MLAQACPHDDKSSDWYYVVSLHRIEEWHMGRMGYKGIKVQHVTTPHVVVSFLVAL